MATQKLQTNQITFLDYTDYRKLEVYIASNLPQTQIYNPNDDTYSPSWEKTKLTLDASVFVDSENITENPNLTIRWYETIGLGDEDLLEDQISDRLEISSNKMTNATFVTYTCKVEYQGLRAQSQIAFVRTNSGRDGANGTSVSIKDTAYYNGTLNTEHTGQIVSLFSDTQCTTPLSTSELSDGDAYIVQGYLCVYSKKSGFICTGEIRGPKGDSAPNIILSASSQMFKIDENQTITPQTITVTGQAINTTISAWTYSTDGGKSFSSLSSSLSGVVINNTGVTITGADMTTDSIIIKASDGVYSDACTIYKVSPGASAPIAFLTNENITFSADAQGNISGTTQSTNVVAYRGNHKVLPTIGAIIGAPEGMEVVVDEEAMALSDGTEIILNISITNGSNLGSSLSHSGTIYINISDPVVTTLTLSWSKINTGATGASGVDAVTFKVYSADGYVLSKETPFIQLKTFAYNGDVPINAEATALYEGATFRWYEASKTSQTETEWVELTEEKTEEIVDENTGETTTITYREPATSPYVTIHHKEVSFSTSYMCKMTFNGMEYVDVVTIDDKNDTNTIFTSKPTAYSEGDIWIVGHDGAPNGIEIGTVLKAQHTNSTYSDSDWVVGTKYDDKLTELETTVGKYRQYISLDTDAGITMNAVNADGKVSEFSTSLSNTELAFKQGDEKVAYINNHKMHITEAEIESPLTVTGRKDNEGDMIQTPTINLGNFSFVIESNGSLSMVSNL